MTEVEHGPRLPRMSAFASGRRSAAALPFVTAPTSDHDARAVTVEALRSPATSWSKRYRAVLATADAVCAAAAISACWLARFGLPSERALATYIWFSIVFTIGWIICLQLAGGYELRAVSTGASEVQRVLRAGLTLAGSAAIVAYLSQIQLARMYIALVIPLGVCLQLVVRYFVRRQVYRLRKQGRWTSAILAVGTSESVRHLIDTTSRNAFAGLVVVGACVEDAETHSELAPGVPVLGDVRKAAEVAERVGADIVAVAGSGLGPRSIRELGWQLEGTGRQMVMAPGLTEVAGPRVHVSPVDGLPLMWVDQPQFTGMRRLVKRAMDVVVASLLLLLGSPFLITIGLLVRLTSRGPALYRSTRVGMNGQPVRVYKFRSMYVDADKRREALVELNEVGGGVLFKMRRDPRVTPVGRFLRKLSIDELPQLINVLLGNMSLVGPRPPLPSEVEQYETHVHRRMLVKPGMTGLWQVSGRSDLCWDEAVRLDLYYVENWSLGFDIAIIVRTVWAVLRSRGAY